MQFKIRKVSSAGAFWYLLSFLCVQLPGQLQVHASPQAEVKRGGALESSMRLEEKAYQRYLGSFYKTYDFKGEYMKQLSPGGKVYFLACRHDFTEALAALKKLPKNDTGSALYVKAFCLENLGKHQEAVAAFTAAKAKIDLVFHPGFRFYLQSSRAFLKAGNEKESFKDLKTANEKILDNTPDDQSAGIIMHMIDRRKILMGELKGKYREACEGYLFTFNFRGDQFRLKDSIVADAATKRKAAEWLKGNINVPAGASDVETARFLLTQGKAYIAVANLAAAKSSLEKASALEMFDPPLTQAERQIMDETGPLRKVKDQARVLLVKLYYKEKNYQKCCVYLRKLYSRDPQTELDSSCNIIAMRDVPQLVQKKDVDLHSVDFENRLDFYDTISYSPTKKQIGQVYSIYKDASFLKAREEVDAERFNECYKSLEKFMYESTYFAEKQKDYSFMQISRKNSYLTDYQHAAKLLQSAVGIAAGRKERGLSLSVGGNHAMSDQWLAIEDVLLGRKMRDPKHAVTTGHALTLKEFDEYCHFAAAVRALDKKDLKTATKEFGRIGPPNPKVPSFLPSYAHALKKWCEK